MTKPHKGSPVPFLLQGKNVILVIDGKSHTISKDTHLAYPKIIEALKNKDWDALVDLVEPKTALINFGKGNVSIEGTKVLWKGKEFHNSLANRMIEMYQEGFPIDPMVNFMENLMKNPSMRSVEQLYGFLEKNSLPITEDGHFLAYKKVRSNYYDIHSGTIFNGIGEEIEMERNQVNDNPDQTCSDGLHFCSESYLNHFGDKNNPVMILKINPADVVSIPTDYNGAKGRCCKYTVIAEVDGNPKDAFNSVVDRRIFNVSVETDDDADIIKQKLTEQWPFPTSEEPDQKKTTSKVNKNQLYDLQRKYTGDIEYLNCTLQEARNLVAKNERNKKAKLKIVKAGTDDEVN